MFDFIKKRTSGKIIKNEDELKKRIREILEEDELANSQALKYLDVLPIINKMYGTDESVDNNIQLVLNNVYNDKIKSRIKDELKKYKRYKKLNNIL